MSTVHIAVDAHNLAHDWRGIARYVRAMLARFATRDDVHLTLLTRDLFGRRALSKVLDMERVRVAYRVPRDSDVVWHPWNGTFFRSNRPSVVTFHDAVPFRFPAPDETKKLNDQEPWLKSARHSKAFLANSSYTADEIKRYLAIDPARITITPFAVEQDIFTPAGAVARLPNQRPYVLFVGANEPRKNLSTLRQAHAKAFPGGTVALVIAGDVPDGRNVVSLGALSHVELAAWYRGAMAVAVPSIYEGFGFPLLEAMACGAPVIATRGTSLIEVGGAGCAWVNDGMSVCAWADSLAQIAHDERVRAQLRSAGIRRAADFSWDRCAAQTLEALRSVIAAGGA